MMTKIRRISLHVAEPAPGQYFWVLMEELDDETHWQEVSSSSGAYPSWIGALHEGMKELLQLADDEQVGPRHVGEEADPLGMPLG
ncbi:hypothetical protein [uncultured Variovorax sp.]|uniref:hypothetical protein n=1 Tax=uncultured Variovorax sp. TaxID=114708 RepID=UPI0025FBF0DA|nr:hypothetical protein [uncultured Variovorax sp.]